MATKKDYRPAYFAFDVNNEDIDNYELTASLTEAKSYEYYIELRVPQRNNGNPAKSLGFIKL